MRMETEEFGIDVVLVEPGGIKTNWGIIAAENLKKASKGTAYEKSAFKSADSMKEMYSGSRLSDPKIISDAIVKASTARKPKTRYLIGFGAKPAVFLRRVLSDRLFDRFAKTAM